MISIVVAGRNDDYGGDFEGRFFATAHYNLGELDRRGIAHELVFVEWNPLTDRALLSEKVAAAFPCARCIVVDGAVHRHVSANRYISLFEYHAKNVGARRARGEWLLLTNPDNYLGAGILDFLAEKSCDAETVYRAGWIEVDEEEDLDAPGLSDAYADDWPPFCCASGDFILCARALFDRVGGFREDLAFTNTHKDSIFCLTAFDLTGRTRKIGNTYHLRHARDDQARRRLEYRFLRVPRTPQAHYGLEAECLEEPTAPRITTLRLPRALARRARWRRLPRPRVPSAYGI